MDDDLLETLVVEVPTALESTATPDTTSTASEKPPEPTQRQLPTPTRSPSAAPTTTVSNNAPPNALTLPSAPGNQAQRGNEISADFDSRNIIQGSCTRRSAHATALKQMDDLVGYYSSFYTATKAVNTRPPHQDTLPPPPKSWKQMLKH